MERLWFISNNFKKKRYVKEIAAKKQYYLKKQYSSKFWAAFCSAVIILSYHFLCTSLKMVKGITLSFSTAGATSRQLYFQS